MEWLTKAVDVLKSPRLSGIALIGSSLVLWFPHRYLPPTATVPDKYLVYAFVVLFLSGASLVVSALSFFWNHLSIWNLRRTLRKRLIAQLLHLTPDEQFILAKYLKEMTVTQYLEMDNGVVGSLLGKKLLYQGSNVGRYNTLAININGDVYRHLQEHPELLAEAAPPQATAFERMRFR